MTQHATHQAAIVRTILLMSIAPTTEAAAVIGPSPESVKATPAAARAAMVRNTGAGYTPVRSSFVQKYEGTNRASTLSKLVRERKRRELIAYLLVLTAPGSENHAPWSSAVWIRVLTVTPDPQMTWSRSTLSETWTSLVQLKLVNRERVRRRSQITPRREDRKKGPYVRPDGKDTKDRYFVLPGEFWTKCWFDRLSLPAVAVLLILLKETGGEKEKHLTHAETARYYGISETTAKKGYAELADKGLVTVRDEYQEAALGDLGYTTVRYYTLTGAFSTQARKTAQQEALAERTKRARQQRATKKVAKNGT